LILDYHIIDSVDHLLHLQKLAKNFRLH